MPNKANAEVKALAQTYTSAAIETLAGIMQSKKAPVQARVAAAVALLDRGHGKPTQAVGGEGGGPLKAVVTFGGRYRPACE